VQIGKCLFESRDEGQESFNAGHFPSSGADVDYVVSHEITVTLNMALRYIPKMLLDEPGQFSHCGNPFLLELTEQ
jgi:hypothetical protein